MQELENTLITYEMAIIEKERDGLSLSERLYCVIQDTEDYIQKNNLEEDQELDSILNQLNTIKEIYDERRIINGQNS